MARSTTSAAVGPLTRLVSLLVILPFLLSYINQRYTQRKGSLCFVGPVEDDVVILSLLLGLSRQQPTSATPPPSIQTKSDTADETNGTTAPNRIDNVSSIYGVYTPGAYSGTSRSFQLTQSAVSRRRWWNWGWPSVMSVDSTLAMPYSRLLTRAIFRISQQLFDRSSVASIQYEERNGWCILAGGSDTPLACSNASKPEKQPDGVIHRYPPSGTWTVIAGDTDASSTSEMSRHKKQQQLRVSCPASPTVQSSNQVDKSGAGNSNAGGDFFLGGSIRRNPNKKNASRPNQTLAQILDRPATSFLVALNVYLAYFYWNKRTSPDAVAKIYSKMVFEYDLWRAFTGATAHFEPLHLGFNMMSLMSLGNELEESFGSIIFLFYNVGLIVLTSLMMIGLTWLRIRHTGDASLAETSTVGYSGVLFAWMVVASLERSSTCPIPFFEDMCFKTHSFLGGSIKFNMGPLVQLVIAQFIMPRVSFVGHLAGIICGFLLHWNLLPIEVVCPQVIISAFFLGHLRFARGVLPFEKSSNHANKTVGEEAQFDLNTAAIDDGNIGGSAEVTNQRRSERMQKRHCVLVFVRNIMIAIAVASVLLYSGSMFFSQLLALAFFISGVESDRIMLYHRAQSSHSVDDKRRITTEMSRGGTLWRGAVLAIVLVIITDAMAISSWIIATVNILSERRLLVGFWPALTVLAIRIVVNISGLCLASGILYDLVEVGSRGIFVILFGHVLNWGREIADAYASSSSRIAFEGRGNVLGGTSSAHVL